MSPLAKTGLSVAALLLGGIAAYAGAFAFGAGSAVQTWVINAQLALTAASVGLIWWGRLGAAALAAGLVLTLLGLLLLLSR